MPVLVRSYAAAVIAYLDIETSFEGVITVIGMYRHSGGVVQLVGPAVTARSLREELCGATAVCTFNGEHFDLPAIADQLGVDLVREFRSIDLWLELRRRGIRGGLKVIEERMAIGRDVRGLNGYDAMSLWRSWIECRDLTAIQTLLGYNRDDVVNLAVLERRMSADLSVPAQPAVRVRGVPAGVRRRLEAAAPP